MFKTEFIKNDLVKESSLITKSIRYFRVKTPCKITVRLYLKETKNFWT